MAENKKSIIEEALLDANRIQEALNSNAKEILRSVAKEEIDSMVKESLNEDDYEEEDVEDTNDLTDAEEISDESDEETNDEESDEELELDDIDDTDNDYEDETEMNDMEGSEELNYDDEESAEDYETMDMTGASDEDVIAVYKKLSGDDEIEVVSDNEVRIKDPESGAEYEIKFNGHAEPDGDEYEPNGDEYGVEDDVEETVYEIELDDEEYDDLNENVLSGNIEKQIADIDNENSGNNLEGGFDDEGQNGNGDAHADHIMEEDNTEELDDEDTVEETGYVGGKVKRVATSHTNKKLEKEVSETVKKYNKLLAESKRLKKENEEFRTALKKFRKMLAETVVFNTNLTNVTRLFTEHSTTKEEKEAIISRFDEEATTIKESKRLYKTIVNELKSKKPISETINEKINKDVKSSQSTGQLNESTAYVDASTQRIKDLISRVEGH